MSKPEALLGTGETHKSIFKVDMIICVQFICCVSYPACSVVVVLAWLQTARLYSLIIRPLQVLFTIIFDQFLKHILIYTRMYRPSPKRISSLLLWVWSSFRSYRVILSSISKNALQLGKLVQDHLDKDPLRLFRKQNVQLPYIANTFPLTIFISCARK